MSVVLARQGWLRVERSLDRVFPSGSNPLLHLGAIACGLLALLLLTGIYLFAVFDTSVDGAWRSINRLSVEQPLVGGWLRSLHRYSADAFLLVTLLHLLREALFGHYTGFRRLSWLTGVPLLLFMYISGIGGFWLNWDQLGQYSAVASAQMLDALPLMASALGRNFLHPEAVSDRLFSLLIFVHLGVPLLLLFGLWFHLQRITRPQILPPATLAGGLLLMLATLAALLPVRSQPPADLSSEPTTLAYDWFLLHLHPLADATSPGLTWLLIAAVFLLLLALPLRSPARPPIAVVDADNCNGCRRCVADCPYAAISLEPHPDGRPGRQIAVVVADRCAACGICAGACPSATPFRSAHELVTGIDLPQQPIGVLRRQLQQALAERQPDGKIVVFGCDHGPDVRAIAARDVAAFSLLCIGLLPPSFVEYALRAGASKVIISGCASGSCSFRLGNRWMSERMQRKREPHLRAGVAEHRYQIVLAHSDDQGALREAVERARGCA